LPITGSRSASSTVMKFTGSDGRYLGEVKNGNRLITNISKKGWVKSPFGPVQGGSYGRYGNYGAYGMYGGYEDFPHPDDFK
jgi:hypothetical protein